MLEVNEHEVPKGHPYMPYVGTAADLLRQGPSLNLPQMFMLFLREQMRGLADAALPGGSPPPPLPHAEYGWQPIDRLWSGQPDFPPSFGDRLQTYLGPASRKLLYQATSQYGDSAVLRIIGIAHANGTAVILLYLPEYKFATDPDPDVIRHYQAMAPVFVIPRDVAVDRANWFDHAHLNVASAARLMPTLVAAIQPVLAARRNAKLSSD